MTEPILMKLETYNYCPGTNHHAKWHFNPVMWVVLANSQFATSFFDFIF